MTKVFWDATPDDKKMFVADPSKGSRHNRGCAVDLTLYDLKTGKPIEMVSTYDETTEGAHPNRPFESLFEVTIQSGRNPLFFALRGSARRRLFVDATRVEYLRGVALALPCFGELECRWMRYSVVSY